MGEIEDPLGFDHADDLFFGHGLCSAFPRGASPGDRTWTAPALSNISRIWGNVRYFHHKAGRLSSGLNKQKPRWFNEPAGFFSELPIRIELMTFSLRVKRSTD